MTTEPTSAKPPAEGASETHTKRLSLLTRVLESLAETLDLHEVARRVVDLIFEEFDADRAWIFSPVDPATGAFTFTYERHRDGYEPVPGEEGPLTPSVFSDSMQLMISSEEPVLLLDGVLDARIKKRWKLRSALLQLVKSGMSSWGLGIGQIYEERRWSDEQVDLFRQIGRYASLAITNAELHRKALVEAAKVSAILDQIPEAAAIYDANGALERTNAAAQRELLFTSGTPEGAQHRFLDGKPLEVADLPSMRALRGETVRADYLVRDNRNDADRILHLRAAPIRDESGAIIGSVVLSRDVSEERQGMERDALRRRLAESLATTSLDLAASSRPEGFDGVARAVAETLGAMVMVYLYNRATDQLELAGAFLPVAAQDFAQYVRKHPYRPGEGLPGTVFQIGRPLFFSEIRGDAILEFARTPEERAAKALIHEQSLIACPIESYGERVGALVLSVVEGKRLFDAEDLEFAQAIAERIGAAEHIHKLSRISQEGHRAAEELARREVDARVRLEAVLESAPIGIAVVSADELRFELANARLVDIASIYGKVSPDTKLVGLRVAEVIPDFERELQRVAEAGKLTVDQAISVRSGNQILYFKRIISPVSGRLSGTTQSLTVLMQDVTEQVRAKREIEALAQLMEERSARLDSILGSMTDGLWVYDSAGMVVDVNPAALAMFGLGSRSEAVSRGSFQDFNLRYPDGKPIPASDLPHARALSGAVVPDYLAVGTHLITGKHLDLSIGAAPIESGGIVGAVLVVRDITALQELDRKKDEFLSVASHELRTPLTTIKGYAQLIAQALEDLSPDERSSYLSSILSEIERMMGLISELLDVSRIETNRLQIRPQPVEWTAFLERQASAFRVQNPKRGIRFHSTIPQARLLIDPDRMRQVIDNLISNAIKYSPDASEISVSVELEGDMVQTSIRDQGIGIPKDEISHLFERFHRARNVSSRYYGGLGLGLYIAKAIVEAHRGSITVTSEEGKGSTFTLSLPASMEASAPS